MNPNVTKDYISQMFKNVNADIANSSNKYVVTDDSYNPHLSDYAYMFTLEDNSKDGKNNQNNNKGKNIVGKRGEIQYQSIVEVEETKVPMPNIVNTSNKNVYIKPDGNKNLVVETVYFTKVDIRPEYKIEKTYDYIEGKDPKKDEKEFINDIFSNVMTQMKQPSLPFKKIETIDKKNSFKENPIESSEKKNSVKEKHADTKEKNSIKEKPIETYDKKGLIKEKQNETVYRKTSLNEKPLEILDQTNNNKRCSTKPIEKKQITQEAHIKTIVESNKKQKMINDIIEDNKNNEIYSISVKNSNDDKISKIQGLWKSKRDSKLINIMREKVFIIQKSFRNFLIKKYDLPENYFYNEKFLKLHQQKFEKNYIENMKILFPAAFAESSSDFSSTMPNHNAYENEKIHLFAKILDLDLMVYYVN
jgi:hypothetical protein